MFIDKRIGFSVLLLSPHASYIAVAISAMGGPKMEINVHETPIAIAVGASCKIVRRMHTGAISVWKIKGVY